MRPWTSRLIALGLCLAGSAASGQITAGPAPLATHSVTFASLGTSSVAYDNVLEVSGLSFAERFAGQALSFVGGHDQLGHAAAPPLALQTGLAGRNLSSAHNGSITYLIGVGDSSYPNLDAVGEGSMAVLFPVDQSQVSFRTYLAGGMDGTSLDFDFFARDGSLIDTVTLNNVGDGTKAFTRDGGLQDIAGVSMASLGGNGVVLLEAVGHDIVAPVPEPATWALMAGGLAVVTLVARRRRPAAAQ